MVRLVSVGGSRRDGRERWRPASSRRPPLWLYRELDDSLDGLTKSAGLTRVTKDLIEMKYAQRASA